MNIFNTPANYLNEIMSKIKINDPEKFQGKSMAVIFLTKLCPVGCPFCFFRSNKQSNYSIIEEQEYSLDGENKLVSVLNGLNLETLEISGGGEPFEKFETILKLLQNVVANNIILVTSGYWATNLKMAGKFLEKIYNALLHNKNKPKLFLRLSIDKFHLANIKVENILNIIKVFEIKYKNSKQFFLHFHTLKKDFSINTILKKLDAVKIIKDNRKFTLIQTKNELIIKVGKANIFYSDLRVNLLNKKILKRSRKTFLRDARKSPKKNFSIYQDSSGSYGLDFLISYNGNITTWGNYQSRNVPNIYIDDVDTIKKKLYEDIISYSFLKMSYKERDSIVRSVNVRASDRAIGINIRDFSGIYMLQEKHTMLYYAIMLIKRYLNIKLLKSPELKVLPIEILNVINMRVNKIKALYFKSQYDILQQLKDERANLEELVDVIDLIKLGHYDVSYDNFVKAKQYLNKNNLTYVDNKYQYVRMLNRLNRMSEKTYNILKCKHSRSE